MSVFEFVSGELAIDECSGEFSVRHNEGAIIMASSQQPQQAKDALNVKCNDQYRGSDCFVRGHDRNGQQFRLNPLPGIFHLSRVEQIESRDVHSSQRRIDMDAYRICHSQQYLERISAFLHGH